jgi:hypothetical protein
VVPDAGHALVMDVPGLVVDRVLGFPPTPTEDGAPSARGAARR